MRLAASAEPLSLRERGLPPSECPPRSTSRRLLGRQSFTGRSLGEGQTGSTLLGSLQLLQVFARDFWALPSNIRYDFPKKCQGVHSFQSGEAHYFRIGVRAYRRVPTRVTCGHLLLSSTSRFFHIPCFIYSFSAGTCVFVPVLRAGELSRLVERCLLSFPAGAV